MLAVAAGERDASVLPAVANDGCGDFEPAPLDYEPLDTSVFAQCVRALPAGSTSLTCV
jgi:hypothetical protein